jgi:hypothetical protein
MKFDEQTLATMKRYATEAQRAGTTGTREIARMFDARDVTFLLGLALAGYGGARMSVSWTCIAIGAVLILKVWSPPRNGVN